MSPSLRETIGVARKSWSAFSLRFSMVTNQWIVKKGWRLELEQLVYGDVILFGYSVVSIREDLLKN